MTTRTRVTPGMLGELLFAELDHEIDFTKAVKSNGGLSLKEIVERVSYADGERIAGARIVHWGAVGLFDVAGIDIGPRHLGRGRVRRYPEGAVQWCNLWNCLAERGLDVAKLEIVTSHIRSKAA